MDHPAISRAARFRDSVVMRKDPIDVVLSNAKHLAILVAYEDEILRLSPQDDIATQSLSEGGAD